MGQTKRVTNLVTGESSDVDLTPDEIAAAESRIPVIKALLDERIQAETDGAAASGNLQNALANMLTALDSDDTERQADITAFAGMTANERAAAMLRMLNREKRIATGFKRLLEYLKHRF